MSRLIDAYALYEKSNKIRKEEIALYGVGNSRFCSTLSTALYEIEFAPIIEERKTGKWIEDVKSKRYRCDQCLSFALRTDDGKENLSDFCPVCGSAMEGK